MKLQTIGIVIRGNDKHAHKVAQKFVKTCMERNVLPIISADSVDRIPENLSVVSLVPNVETASLKKISNTADAVVVLGGDGTYLSAAERLYKKDCPLIGVNMGHLGFLTDIPSSRLEKLLDDIATDKLKIEKRTYYKATLFQNGEEVWQAPFINDAVIQRNANEKMIRFELDAGTWRIADARADGMIISTPTGSTAYNLSTGGPILHPNIEALVLAPICPHNLSFRPVVVPPKEISITLETNHGHLSLDGRHTQTMHAGDKVVVEKTEHTLTMLVNEHYNFFDVLREKFGWDKNIGATQICKYEEERNLVLK